MSQVDTTSGTVPYSSNGQTRTWTYTYATTPAAIAAAGLLASVDGPLSGTGDTVSYTYDTNGYVNTVTNEVGHVTTVNTKNARGQPTQITDANGVVSNLSYDFQGRLLTVTVNPGASQAVTSFDYNAIGQITKVTRPDGSWFSYTYDNARRLTTVTSINGETINYTRDLMGNITATNIKTAGGTIVFSQTQTFDELGRLLQNIGANSQTTAYAYEKNDNLKSVTDPRSGIYSVRLRQPQPADPRDRPGEHPGQFHAGRPRRRHDLRRSPQPANHLPPQWVRRGEAPVLARQRQHGLCSRSARSRHPEDRRARHRHQHDLR